jgi:hypothetical protein
MSAAFGKFKFAGTEIPARQLSTLLSILCGFRTNTGPLSPLCAAKRILIWRPDWRERDAHASSRSVRPTPEIFAVAGLALGIVVYRRHDRLNQYVAAWHRHPNMLPGCGDAALSKAPP